MPPRRPSGLDDLSVAIGDIQASLRSLFKRADEDRDTQARQHIANQLALGAMRNDMQTANSELRQSAVERWQQATVAIDRVADIATARDDEMKVAIADLGHQLAEHSAAVSNIKPQITSLQMSRGRLAALATTGVLALWVVARAIEMGINQLVGLVVRKLGGP